MSYQDLPAPIRGIAETTLTPKQREAFTLEQDNLGIRHIARTLHISRPAVLDRLDGAHRALRRHGVIQDADGTWSVRPQDGPSREDSPNPNPDMGIPEKPAQRPTERKEDAA